VFELNCAPDEVSHTVIPGPAPASSAVEPGTQRLSCRAKSPGSGFGLRWSCRPPRN